MPFEEAERGGVANTTRSSPEQSAKAYGPIDSIEDGNSICPQIPLHEEKAPFPITFNESDTYGSLGGDIDDDGDDADDEEILVEGYKKSRLANPWQF